MDDRIRREFLPGHSTATPLNLSYRLGKLRKLGLLTGRWLDLGCADGSYAASMLRHGASAVAGVDVAADRVEKARHIWMDEPNLEFHHSPNGALPFADNTFDGVLMNEVLEHVYDEAETLRGVFRVLKPGGSLVIISPNRYFPFEGHGGLIGKIELHFPVPFLPWLPRQIGQKVMRARNYWPHEIEKLVTNAGLEVTSADFVWPVLEVYKWLPAALIRAYQKLIPAIERVPGLRRFGVSALVVGTKPRIAH